MISSSELRTRFLEYFRSQGHEVVASSSLVPGNDPTLLFTNAGMVQFKDVFLGLEHRPYVRAASSQRCVRAGGKHNDLENVGYTARHHTFFEMLGNFSFGDYFKREAIHYAWDFLTVVLKLPPEKLWITVFEEDDEAADIWLKEIKVDAQRFARIGAKDNFWSMGDTGPCGPCTEIFYDHGPKVAGGPPGTPEADGDRYIEIWNLVFMQYNRAADGAMTPLPKPSVDTGMGLERLAAVLQGVHSNYEIDLFRNLIQAAAKLAGIKDTENNSLKVIADHIRSCSFLMADGVTPSNEGRGYVLRRIIRRAVRHGHGLGLKEPFFYKLVAPLVKEMGAAYPELVKAQSQVERALKQEEDRFAETLSQGMQILESELSDERRFVSLAKSQSQGLNRFQQAIPNSGRASLSFTSRSEGKAIRKYCEMRNLAEIENLENYVATELIQEITHLRSQSNNHEEINLWFVFLAPIEKHKSVRDVASSVIAKSSNDVVVSYDVLESNQIPLNGDIAFKLYDTFGFPVDLTADYAKSHGVEVDMAGFEQAMEQQRERARAASQFGVAYATPTGVEGCTEFTGYEHLQEQSKVLALYRGDESVSALNAGEEGAVVLERTPFYAESGGQVGDRGVIESGQTKFDVRDTQKLGGDVFGHIGKVVKGSLRVGNSVTARVDEAARQATVINHSATHLMHAALRKVLGEHVTQKGSLVDPGRLRFDFAHFAPVSREELLEIERLVNEQIRANAPVETRVMAFEEARTSGAMALFGEKYGDSVRVLRIGDFSMELCGGTHAQRAGDIGLFKIVSEAGVASGVRRIEAVTGQTAVAAMEAADDTLARVAGLVKAGRDDLEDKVQQLIERSRKLEKELEQLKGKLASTQGSDLASQAVDIGGLKVLAARLDGADSKALRDTVDQLKNKLGSAAVVLATVSGDKVSLVAGVTADHTQKVKAGDLVNMVAQQVGGKGGGRADMAQAGGTDPAGLDAALRSVTGWVRQQLG